jgi:hypothetical protein
MMIQKKVINVLFFLVVCIIFVACGSSESDLNAQSTQIAANIYATETAQAPASTPTTTRTPKPTPTPSTTPSPTPSPAPSDEKARLAIANAYSLTRDRPLRARSFTEYRDGETATCTRDIDPLNRRYHLKCETYEVIAIITDQKQTIYLKTAQGWEGVERTGSASFLVEETDESITEIEEAQIVRNDVLDGISVIVYRYSKSIVSETGNAKREYNADVELWVGDADGLIYKMIIDAVLVSGDGQGYKTTVWFKYDIPISISPP